MFNSNQIIHGLTHLENNSRNGFQPHQSVIKFLSGQFAQIERLFIHTAHNTLQRFTRNQLDRHGFAVLGLEEILQAIATVQHGITRGVLQMATEPPMRDGRERAPGI